MTSPRLESVTPSGPDPRLSPGDLLLVACVRNERLRLPAFLEHYRRSGVDRFLVVDNDSDDGTGPYLSRQADVSLFSTRASYAANRYGMVWANELLRTYAPGHWVLTVDADELFVFPGWETTGLRAVVSYLDQKGDDAVEAFLLDMYGPGPIRRTPYSAGDSLLAACPYFDSMGYRHEDGNPFYHFVPTTGGPRHRLFWHARATGGDSPFLGKTPLVKWRPGLVYESSTHQIRGLRLGELTGALLHFKFLADFVTRVSLEVERGEHWNAASEYRAYATVLEAQPDLTAFHASSVRFSGTDQLIALGFMKRPADFLGPGT